MGLDGSDPGRPRWPNGAGHRADRGSRTGDGDGPRRARRSRSPAGRDQGKLDALRRDLTAATGEDRFPTVVGDMSSLDDVRSAAAAIRGAHTQIDLLIDNAGSIVPRRTASPDGIEASMALMAVGPFALVAGLLPLLRASDDARVIAVTSGGMYTQAIDVDDLDGEAVDYSGPSFYARAKRPR